jgi:preprotein translocase subunit SecA
MAEGLPAGIDLTAGMDDAGGYQRVGVPVTREAPKVGRNDPCPCGSGKKYKKCCGQ